MPHAKPDYAIAFTLIAILLAIGIPSLRNGQLIIGVVCISLAVFVSGWLILALIRMRRQ